MDVFVAFGLCWGFNGPAAFDVVEWSEMKISAKDFVDPKVLIHWAIILVVVLSVVQFGFVAAFVALAVTDVVTEKMLGM